MWWLRILQREMAFIQVTQALVVLSIPNYVYLHPGVKSLRRNSVSTSSDSGCSGLSSTTCSSAVRDSTLLSIPITVGMGLWKDNPEHDQYYTFCVSEDDVTKIISYLENQLAQQKHKASSDTAAEVPTETPEELKKDVSPKVTFILDTYCHMYMARWVYHRGYNAR